MLRNALNNFRERVSEHFSARRVVERGDERDDGVRDPVLGTKRRGDRRR
jgi:hypothetical protein